MVGVDDGGAGGAEKGRRVRLPSEMDKRRSRSARWSKMCWRAAKGALSSPRTDTVAGAVLDDASTSSRDCGGVSVLPVDNEVEVAEVGRDPTSLGVRTSVVVPESVWGRLEFSAGDDCVRELPSRSEGLEAKR